MDLIISKYIRTVSFVFPFLLPIQIFNIWSHGMLLFTENSFSISLLHMRSG